MKDYDKKLYECGGFNDLEGSGQHSQRSFFSFETPVNRAL